MPRLGPTQQRHTIATPLTLVSGGQAGVDRAALDAAMALGIAVGGWCPKGRWAEDGPIPARYPLRETPSADPAQRTRWNVRDADATLILSPAPLRGGTALTVEIARELGRPTLVADPVSTPPDAAVRWLARLTPRVLNVAGPRASEWSRAEAVVVGWLSAVLRSG